MATKRTYSKLGIAAIIGGVWLTAIEIYGAVSYLVSQSQPHYLVAGGAVVTAVAVIHAHPGWALLGRSQVSTRRPPLGGNGSRPKRDRLCRGRADRRCKRQRGEGPSGNRSEARAGAGC
jgi:hypothetical protein